MGRGAARPHAWLREGISVTTTLICDDRRSVGERLIRALSGLAGVTRIQGVAHAEDLLAHYVRQRAELVLVGTSRADPTGVRTIRRLVAARPRASVLAFGGPDDVVSIAAAIVEGACGFLRWDPSTAELAAAEHELVTALTNRLINPITNAPPAVSVASAPRASDEAGVRLTEREQQVLRGMSQGKGNGQIGHELFLSEDTIETHARRLFGKLGAHDRAYGFRRGLIS
jgi:DNA-binding NarL/FixJ family response regulator